MFGCVEKGSWRAWSRMFWSSLMSLFCGEEGADGHWVDVDPADDAPLPSSAF